jgi:hypothetical protein
MVADIDFSLKYSDSEPQPVLRLLLPLAAFFYKTMFRRYAAAS